MSLLRSVIIAIVFLLSPVVQAEQLLAVEQALQRMLQSQPALEAAELQRQRANLQMPVVKSQLGWLLNAQAGASRDIGFTGIPSDRVDMGTGVQRSLQSGGSVGVDASVSQEDSELPLFSSYPNPATTTKLDLNFRKPLNQGAGNPTYQNELISAEAGADIARAEQKQLRDQMGSQVLNLFYLAALTRARMANVEAAIDRGQRLQKFIDRNIYLGISENKDRLQIRAQLHALEADLKALRVNWEFQRTSLNRYMGRPWDEEFRPDLKNSQQIRQPVDAVLAETLENSSSLLSSNARLKSAEAFIKKSRDQQRNKFDLVFSVGGRNLSGESVSGDINETDYAGNLRFEFSRALNRSGVDAQLTQAQLDRSITLKQIQDIKLELRYRVNGLLAEMAAASDAYQQSKVRLDSEQKKYNEANYRYRNGRANISELIQFENDLRQSQLVLELNHVDLLIKHSDMSLLRGTLWQGLDVETAFLTDKLP